MRAMHVRVRLITTLAPGALLIAVGLASGQPAPPVAPVPAVPPIAEVPTVVAPEPPVKVPAPPRAKKMAPEALYEWGEFEALAESAKEITTRALAGIDVEALANLKVETARWRQSGREIKPPRAASRGCGSRSIDNVEEADAVYECGRRALDRAAWDDALQSFSTVAASKQGPRAIGAYYWRAYAQHRLGQRAEALATLGELKSAYPSSGWAAEANALEMEIRQSTGQRVSPDTAPDEDMKLLALQGLAASDVETAVPMIESVLKGSQSPRVKERALFVLAQSNKPAAREVVVRVAKGGANPDLQLKAVQYVGMFRTPEGLKVLGEIYGSTSDYTVRRSILRSYMVAGAREPLLQAARQEGTAELRLEAVRQLANLRAGSELADLYARESSPEVKKQILRGLANVGQSDKLIALAQSESNPDLRRTAIRSLGLNRDAATATLLTQLYAKEQSPEVKDAVIDALYTQQNAAALVTLARQEKDPALKLALVRRLSTMSASPEALEYMKEILK